jgi:hypothetical protein
MSPAAIAAQGMYPRNPRCLKQRGFPFLGLNSDADLNVCC